MESTTMGWLLLVVGFVPWRMSQRRVSQHKGKQVQRWNEFQLQATFWQLRIARHPQGCTW
jgi:hypothetical protein